jgi:hypothetical protein
MTANADTQNSKLPQVSELTARVEVGRETEGSTRSACALGKTKIQEVLDPMCD